MRASSLPRSNIINHANLTLDAYERFGDPSNQRLMSTKTANKDFELNFMDPYNPHKVLRTEGDARNMPSNLNYLSYQGKKILNDSRAPTNWEEFMLRQGDVAISIEQQRIREEKLRSQKYRETLQKMMEDEKKRKLEMRKELMNPANDFSELEALTELEKLKRQQERNYYYNQLQQLIMQKNEKKKIEEQKRHQEELRLKTTMEQLKQYEEFKKSFKNTNYVPGFDEYKRMIDGDQKLSKFKGQDNLSNYYDTSNTINKAGPKIINVIEDNRQRQLDEFINESVRKKVEQDALEMMKREEALKRIQMETHSINYNKAQEKFRQTQFQKQTKKEEYEQYLENQKLMEQIDDLRKEREKNQRREYTEILKHQTQTKKNTELQANSLTTAEKALNFRRKAFENSIEESGVTSLPLPGTCYERNLQLRMLDNWLRK